MRPAAGEVTQNGRAALVERIMDRRAILVLLLVTLSLRVMMLCRTQVPARDSIGYIRYALEFERPDLSWGDVLRKNHQHPGYPLAVLAFSYPVRLVLGLTPFSMQLSAQLASSAAAVLLIFPMFYLGKLLWDRRLGFWGSLLFQFLPGPSHILSDGISEAVFLVWCVSAIYFACRGLERGPAWCFALCGLFSGLAYLTRPEGALVLVSAGLVLIGIQVLPAWRQSWGRLALQTAALCLPALALASSYVLPTGHISNKPSVNDIITVQRADVSPKQGLAGGPLFAAMMHGASADVWHKLRAALYELGLEIVVALHYFWVLPALLGLWFLRGDVGRSPAYWLLGILCALYAAVLVRLGMREGYISNRHVLVLVICTTYALAWALCELPRRLPGMLSARHAGVLSLAGMLTVVGTCLPKTLQPLHHNRAGHYAAGQWLIKHVQPGDEVRDDHCWAHYYSGQVFLENKPVPYTPGALCYTVISRSRDPENHARIQDEQRVIAGGAKMQYHWPEQVTPEDAKVVIYAAPRQWR